MSSQEKIYTIPVNDAFAAEGDLCPLCRLRATVEEQLLDYYLGPSLMEPDVREESNAKGFCREHLQAMYNSQKNRLGLGLMLHTHLKAQKEVLLGGLEGLANPSPKSFWQRKTTGMSPKEVATQLRQTAQSCLICERLDSTMARYVEVICWQYFHDEGFRQRFLEAAPFCTEHLALLIEGAERHLKSKEQLAFWHDLHQKQSKQLQSLTEEVEWFTLKFDYRNEDKPWGNSKTAVARAIQTLEGRSELH